MTPIFLVMIVVRAIEALFVLVLAGMSVWAFSTAVQASDYAYQSAFKRTKRFWVIVTALCLVFSLLSLWTTYRGGGSSIFLQLIVATAAGVFLADVKPAVSVRRR